MAQSALALCLRIGNGFCNERTRQIDAVFDRLVLAKSGKTYAAISRAILLAKITRSGRTLSARNLRERTVDLSQHPEPCRIGRPGLADHIRELVIPRNYIVFYSVLDEARTVEILRVKHVAQQPRSRISPASGE